MHRATCAARSCTALLSVLLASLLIAPRPAAGQGTEGTLPDPISSRELDQYARRLSLSDQQREALQSIHNTYRAEFARLRDGEIEAYLQTHGGFGGFSINFDRAAVKEETDELKKLLGKIRAVDRRFFEQMQPLLAEEQLLRLPRIRQAREVQRYRMGLPFLGGVTNPSASVDLSTIVEDLDFTPEQRQAIDAVLATYERQLVAAARALHEVALNRRLIMFDRMEAMGYGAEALADPENAEGLFQAFFSAMSDVQARLNEEAGEIGSLNRRTLKTLVDLLPAEQAETLRIRFYGRAYSEILAVINPARWRFEEALKLTELTDEQRQAINSLRSGYRLSRDRLIEQGLDLYDRQRTGGIMINPSPEQEEEQTRQREKLQSLREQGRQLVQQTIDSLDRILGNELTGRVAKRVADREEKEGQTETRAVMIMSVATGGGEDGISISTLQSSVVLDEADLDAGLNPLFGALRPMSRQELFGAARRLELTDDERMIVEALHGDYLQQYEETAAPAVEEARQAERAVSPFGGGDEEEERLPSPGDVDRLFALRRGALTAVQETDGRLFDQIALVIEEEERAARVDRLRLARQRSIFSRAVGEEGGFTFGGGGGAFIAIGGGGSSESSVDLAAVVDELDLPEETMAAVDPLLLDYEQQVTDVFRRHYEARQAVDEHMQKMSVRARRDASGRGARSFSLDAEAHEAVEARRVEAREAESRIVQLNRSTCEALRRSLEPSTAQRLQRAYDRQAFRSVFRDPSSVASTLEAALALDDLTGDQRTRLTELAAEYRASYEECCQRMIELHKAGAGDPGSGEFNFQAMQEQMRELEKTRFTRDDLNDRTRTALRVLLTEAQASRIGGLEDAKRP